MIDGPYSPGCESVEHKRAKLWYRGDDRPMFMNNIESLSRVMFEVLIAYSN